MALAIPRLWRKMFGRSGERAAERFLRKRGCRILARNFRCPAGEIDLIVLDRQTLVFVEVKSRLSSDHADPEESVNRNKRRHIVGAARHYLRLKGAEDRPCRFDVVTVVGSPGRDERIRHISDAFDAAD